MLTIDIAFKCNGIDFTFNEQIEQDKLHTFEVGEPILAYKLFHVLIGLDKEFKGTITDDRDETDGGGVNFTPAPGNNVLAIGNRTMFVRGSVKRNIYKAQRSRTGRAEAKSRLQQIIEAHNLGAIADKPIRLLTDEELFSVAAARAHFRELRLVVVNSCETFVQAARDTDELKKFWTNFPGCYKIEVI